MGVLDGKTVLVTGAAGGIGGRQPAYPAMRPRVVV